MQRILMNFAQTFCSTANTMKLLFAISVVSVCLFLVTARFVHFIHRQEIEEDLNTRDDNEVTGFFDMPSRSSSKIHIASCRPRGARCRRDSDCCSYACVKYEAVFISKILFTVQIQLCLIVIQLCRFVFQLCPFVIQLCLLVIQLCRFVFQLCPFVIQLCLLVIHLCPVVIQLCLVVIQLLYLIMTA